MIAILFQGQVSNYRLAHLIMRFASFRARPVRGRPKVFPASSGIAKQLTNSFKLPDACGDAGGPDTDDDNVISSEICLQNIQKKSKLHSILHQPLNRGGVSHYWRPFYYPHQIIFVWSILITGSFVTRPGKETHGTLLDLAADLKENVLTKG